eukprot:CAMPEP_0182519718 /NCGR_PEP_ID=MMETSP1321-20130603/45242_1 /TAXON_ID=91990 /ORGANISM="Bolidomonas sp., Strain RCC1657" /LENGTH=313 /DNA_ID=CAMNT_0024727703 /DNA_START=90 /DNA_END=1028 /DNA_ORIENTATION=-
MFPRPTHSVPLSVPLRTLTFIFVLVSYLSEGVVTLSSVTLSSVVNLSDNHHPEGYFISYRSDPNRVSPRRSHRESHRESHSESHRESHEELEEQLRNLKEAHEGLVGAGAAALSHEELEEQLRNLKEAHEGLVGAGAADIYSSEELEERLRSLKEAHEGLANSQDIRISTVYCRNPNRGDSGGQFIEQQNTEQLIEGTLNLRGGASDDDVSNGGDNESDNETLTETDDETSCRVSSKKKKKKKKKKEKKTIAKKTKTKTKTKEKKRIQTKDVLAEDKLTKQIMGKKNTKKKIKATLSSSSNSDESIRASIRSL